MMSGYNDNDDGSSDSGVMSAGPSRDAVKKMDQIIQVRARRSAKRGWGLC